VTGLRFYKSAANTGTHTGTLWSATGQQLATGTFTGESATGWQTLTFSTPVSITANTQYVVSYHAPAGHYAADGGYFTNVHTYYPLTAPANVNGLYSYGPTTTFPTNTYNTTNYWVDPIFQTTAPAASPAAALTSPSARVSGTRTAGATGAAVTPSGTRTTLREDPVMDARHPITTVLPATADPASVKMTVVTAAPVTGKEWQAGTEMPGYVTFDPATHVVAFHPNGMLPRNGAYRVTVTADVDNDDPTPPLTWVIQPTAVAGGTPHVPGEGTPVGVAPGVLPSPSYGSRSNKPGIR
jgi:hypothetical protein